MEFRPFFFFLKKKFSIFLVFTSTFINVQKTEKETKKIRRRFFYYQTVGMVVVVVVGGVDDG